MLRKGPDMLPRECEWRLFGHSPRTLQNALATNSAACEAKPLLDCKLTERIRHWSRTVLVSECAAAQRPEQRIADNDAGLPDSSEILVPVAGSSKRVASVPFPK